MSTSRDSATLGKVHELVDQLDNSAGQQSVRDNLWRDASTALQNYPKDSAQMNYISRTLEENGVLPRLLFDIADCTGKYDPIDTDHDDHYTRDELEAASNSNDKVVALAAQYALKNYNDINTDHETYGPDKGLSTDEIAQWKKDHGGDDHPNNTSPYYEGEHKLTQDELESRLNNPHSTPQERLDAVQKLADDYHVKEVTLVDSNGQPHKYELQSTDVGNGRKMVHLWDEKTHKIVLRGVGKEGEYEKENGVEYQGRDFSRLYTDADRSVIADSKY